MENQYKFTFGYLALKMLGKTLYSNPFAALSELIANGFDAKGDTVWVYLDIREKAQSKVVVIDNGLGMTDSDVLHKYLQVGKANRPQQDNNMMGRKGIGKLAAFYLSNKYYLHTKTDKDRNSYEIDFSQHENGVKLEDDDSYMSKISDIDFPQKEIFERNATGTALYLTDVNFRGYGEKTFDVLEGELAELFSIKGKKIYLKIVYSDEDLNEPFKSVRKKIAYKNMAKIFYKSIDSDLYKTLMSQKGKEIKHAEKKVADTKVYTQVDEMLTEPSEATIGEKTVRINPRGWIGIHQTIKRDMAHLNDPNNFIDSKFYHFNKVRIYVRGKLALDNILPYVHNTQYYVNYIEGEIHCDELDSNDLPDIASSSRQDIDKNDERFISLVDFIKEIVRMLVNFKNEQTNKDLDLSRKKQRNAVSYLSKDIETTLKNKVGQVVKYEDIQGIKHSVVNSFEKVEDIAKTDYMVFLSHRSQDRYISDFIYNYLLNVCKFEEKFIFYTSKSGGVDESLEVLEKQINAILTNTNSYVVFCIGSEKFMESEYCMFEGGAAWATKQKDSIGLIYNDYDKFVPTYLKSMKKTKVNFANPIMNRDLYVSIIKLLNSLIDYINRNYIDETNKKPLINENLPDEVQLEECNQTLESSYDKNVINYWNKYVLGFFKKSDDIKE